MDVLNMNEFAVHPRVVSPSGQFDTVHVMAKRRTTLPPGYSVDANWLASMTKVSVFDDNKTKIASAVGTGTLTNTTAVAPGNLVPMQIQTSVSSVADAQAIEQAQRASLALAQAQVESERTSQSSAPDATPTPESN